MRKPKRIPRPISLDPMGLVRQNVSLLSDDQIAALRLRELSSLEALRSGRGELADLKDLADVLNMAETLASMGVGPEAKPSIDTAQEALLAIKKRVENWGKIQVLPSEVDALSDMQAWYDLQRQSVDRATLTKATNLCFNRIRGAHPSVKEWI